MTKREKAYLDRVASSRLRCLPKPRLRRKSGAKHHIRAGERGMSQRASNYLMISSLPSHQLTAEKMWRYAGQQRLRRFTAASWIC